MIRALRVTKTDGTFTAVDDMDYTPFAPVADPIGAPIVKGAVRIELETVASGLTAPVHLTNAGDGSQRIFIVDQDGQILILSAGELLAQPFLDVSSLLVTLGFFGSQDEDDFDERGLLGFDFHPDYNNPEAPGFGKIYTYTSEPNIVSADFTVTLSEPEDAFFHHAVITEWCVDANDPNRIDPATRRVIMRIEEPQFNHDGGMVAFGPDGYLYFSLGDGGSGNDVADGHTPTHGNGQDKTSILGSIVRIDPLDPVTTPASSDPVSANGQYRVPASNPFVSTTGVDEIFAYGFRNPYRFSFSPHTGDLLVADVGQGTVEEVDTVTNGGNYGWNFKEGSFTFDPATGQVSNQQEANPAGLTDPTLQYDRSEGTTVIGGYVYDGSALPVLAGRYLFGDFSGAFFLPSGRLFHGDLATGEILEFVLGFDDRDLDLYVKGFGVDESGEVYLLAGTNLGPFGSQGVVLKIVPAVCSPIPIGDLNGNCIVYLIDFVLFASSWLDCNIMPQEACSL